MYNVHSVAIRKSEHYKAGQWKILVNVCHVGLVGNFLKIQPKICRCPIVLSKQCEKFVTGIGGVHTSFQL